jgi:hypothetical protein
MIEIDDLIVGRGCYTARAFPESFDVAIVHWLDELIHGISDQAIIT